MARRTYSQFVKCSDCGKKIPIGNAHYFNGKPYGYSCYKKQLALLYKQFEDENNAEYSAKCFAAMQIFERKKNNSFHESVSKQWNNCNKLTARQLECIIRGFTDQENIDFWIIWQQLTNDMCLKYSIASWVEGKIKKSLSWREYIENDAIINCLLYNRNYYKYGFHFYYYTDGDPHLYLEKNGKDDEILKMNKEHEDLEVLKVIRGAIT